MIKQIFSLVILFNFASSSAITQVGSIDLDSCKSKAVELAAYNKKARFVKTSLGATIIVGGAVAAGYGGYKTLSWAGGKLLAKPYSCEFGDDINWDAFVKGYNRMFDKLSDEEVYNKFALLEKERRGAVDKFILQACTSVVIKDYCAPILLDLLITRDVSWASKGLKDDFYNCKLSAINVNPNSKVLAEVDKVKLNVENYNIEEALEALKEGASAQVYIQGSVMDEALDLKLKAAASQVSYRSLSQDILDVYTEAFSLHMQKIANKVALVVAALIADNQLQAAETLVKVTNGCLENINENLSNKDFDFLSAVATIETVVNVLKSAV